MALGLFEGEYAPIASVHLSQGSYTPGQHLVGQVSLELSKSYRFSNILVVFTGGEVSVSVNDESGEKLAVGEHIFPFDFLIPFNLPDSFETGSRVSTTYGIVKYCIQVKISNPSLFRSTIEKEVAVLIHTPYNGPQYPVSLPVETSMGSWFCFGSSGTVCWTLKVSTNVWVAGEEITLTVFVDNRKAIYETSGAYARLRQYITLRAKETNWDSCKISCGAETTERVPAKQTGLLTMQMRVPMNIKPTCNLGILQCAYTLHVYIDIPYNTDPVIKVPITICREKSTGSVMIGSPQTPTAPLEFKAPIYSLPSPPEPPPVYRE